MANIHVLKNTHNECVLKIYSTASGGQTIAANLDSSYIMLDNEQFVGDETEVTIREIFWGAKKDKQIDITRVVDHGANTVHGHYYLLNSGSYNFDGFVDNSYANSDIRIISDGPFHMILKLGKSMYRQS
jgi:hypothetical protein